VSTANFTLQKESLWISEDHVIQVYAVLDNVPWPNVSHGLAYSWTELLTINPGIVHPFQQLRHHYQATATGTTFPVV